MIYFIVNRHSKSGKGFLVWRETRDILMREGVEYKAFCTRYAGHATMLAKKISSLPDSEIKLVVLGGDGTVNEAINGIADFSKVCFGVIPTGSGNDFAGGLGLKGNIRDYVRGIIHGTDIRAIDVGRVSWNGCEGPRYFVISAGIGLDAIVCKKALTSKQKAVLNRFHLGKLTYLLLTIETLFGMRTARASACFDGSVYRRFDKLIFAAAMNFSAEGGGVPMAPHASAEDGRLSVCMAHGVPKWLTFFVLPFLVAARHEKLSCFFVKDFGSCSLHLNRPMTLHADGEYMGEASDVHFECLKGRLWVMLP